MTLIPFLTAEFIVQLHAATALIAILSGPFALYRRRRDSLHKYLGYLWVGSMALAIISSFFITNFGVVGPFSPIHILSVLAAWSLWSGMTHVFAGRIREHEQTMRSLYWTGLMVAGAFNFLPGRVTNRIFFNDDPALGYVVLAAVIAGILARGAYLRRRKQVSVYA